MGHPYFEDGGAPKPDLLVHQPGHGNNYAIVEVKSCRVAADGIRKDLNTLSLFRNQFGYQRAILSHLWSCSRWHASSGAEMRRRHRAPVRSSYGYTRQRPHLQCRAEILQLKHSLQPV